MDIKNLAKKINSKETDESLVIEEACKLIDILKKENDDYSDEVDDLKEKKADILHKKKAKEYIYHIEELYNKGNSKRYILYK